MQKKKEKKKKERGNAVGNSRQSRGWTQCPLRSLLSNFRPRSQLLIFLAGSVPWDHQLRKTSSYKQCPCPCRVSNTSHSGHQGCSLGMQSSPSQALRAMVPPPHPRPISSSQKHHGCQALIKGLPRGQHLQAVFFSSSPTLPNIPVSPPSSCYCPVPFW